jgi:hypothetical protein
VFAWKNVLITVWSGDASVELLKTLGRVVEAKVREVGRVSSVNIVVNVPALPNDEKRQAYKAFTAKNAARYAHMVVVLEGEGFMFSAVRGLVTGLLMATRQQYGVGVMNNIDEVTLWLPARHATSTGVTLVPAELREVLGRARAQALGTKRA